MWWIDLLWAGSKLRLIGKLKVSAAILKGHLGQPYPEVQYVAYGIIFTIFAEAASGPEKRIRVCVLRLAGFPPGAGSTTAANPFGPDIWILGKKMLYLR